jgi:hypothetical protein
MQGFAIGFRTESDAIADRVANSIRMPLDAFNRTNVTNVTNNQQATDSGGFNGTVLVQIGNEQIERATVRVISGNPQEVALAAEAGALTLLRRR